MRSEVRSNFAGLVALAAGISLLVAGAILLAPQRSSITFDPSFHDPATTQPLATIQPPVTIEPPCDYVVAPNVSHVDGNGSYASVQPGDTLCLTAGTRGPLSISNLSGSEEAPISLINDGGVVVIDGRRNDYAALDIRDSQHLRISGTGVSVICGRRYPTEAQNCGIVASGTGRGVAATGRVSNIEVDHVEVTDTARSGMFMRSSDDTDNPRQSWRQRATRLHDNYLHDLGTEGFYVGSSKYHEGVDPLLDGVEVGRNLIIGTGWDGLQVGSAVTDCRIHDNVVIGSGLDEEPDQQTGVINNRGSTCDIFNNLVEDVTGAGIFVQGNGGNRVFNNVVVRTSDGIVVTRGSNDDRSVFLLNNTIVDPARFGIRFRNDEGADNQIVNNLIILPRGDAYIDIGGLDNVTVDHNLLLAALVDAKLADPGARDYRLVIGSPAIDAGADLPVAGIASDFPGGPRRFGTAVDIGAFEFGGVTSLG